jgi:hypothetical protein
MKGEGGYIMTMGHKRDGILFSDRKEGSTVDIAEVNKLILFPDTLMETGRLFFVFWNFQVEGIQ